MKQKLLKILDNFNGKKILVVGDVMLDKYIWGDVSRISPEAPVQVVNVLKETYEAGGAANVANNVAALGGLPYMVGISGNDEARNVLMEEMRKKCINTGGIIQDKDKPTTQKVRIIGKSQQLLRVDYENKEHIHHDIENSIIKFAEKNINEVDVVVISDYAKGVITQEVSSKIISLAKQNKKQVIVDPKPKHRNWYIGVDLITPNNNEASEMSGIEDGSDESVIEMGKSLLKNLSTNVLLTKGEKGMSLFEKDGSVSHIPAKAKEVYSLIGAGDTVVATAALAIASGADLKEAAFLANIAAGIKVGKIGTASVATEEIKAELENF